jgi:diguanylate cyclase (GGDEF)-like protein
MLSDPGGEVRSIRRTNKPSSRVGNLEFLQCQLAAANRRIAQLLRERTESRKAISRLTAMATTDVLTELGNRRRFEEVLGAHFALSIGCDSPLSVIMVDVDGFKSYNDAFGHSAGDAVLCVVAQQLVKSSRGHDVVTRYGGEEFAIVLPQTDAAAALGYAERQREAIASFAWPLRPVTASFGVVTRTPSIADMTMLMHGADRALYVSKRGGRNRVTHVEMIDDQEPLNFQDPRVVAPPGTGRPAWSFAGFVSETNPSSRSSL